MARGHTRPATRLLCPSRGLRAPKPLRSSGFGVVRHHETRDYAYRRRSPPNTSLPFCPGPKQDSLAIFGYQNHHAGSAQHTQPRGRAERAERQAQRHERRRDGALAAASLAAHGLSSRSRTATASGSRPRFGCPRSHRPRRPRKSVTCSSSWIPRSSCRATARVRLPGEA
jgi:hypothetical protein